MLTEDILKEVEKRVFQETKYHIKLTFKSMKTDWKPIRAENVELNETQEYGDTFRISIFNALSDVKEKNEDGFDEIVPEKMELFMKYVNKFVCLIEQPHAYGWRDRVEDIFDFRNIATIIDRTSTSGINLWKNSDDKLQYEKTVFIVNDKDPTLKRQVYNLYQRPKSKTPEINDLKIISPKFYDYLFRIISNNDTDLYNCMIHYISKIAPLCTSLGVAFPHPNHMGYSFSLCLN